MHNIKGGSLGVTALFFTFNHLIFATCDTLAHNRAASIIRLITHLLAERGAVEFEGVGLVGA